MEFLLLDKVLTESRLYRYSRNFADLDGKDVANLLYLTTLVTYMLTLDDETEDYGLTYAKKTVQYGGYLLFRTHATDLYLLAYAVANPQNKQVNLKNSSSNEYLGRLKFQPKLHWRFIMDMSNGLVTSNDAYSNLYRFETQLKITDSRYKRWRRLILDWRNLKNIQKQLVVAQVTQEFRKIARGSELLVPLTDMLKDRNYVNSDLAAPAADVSSDAVAAAATAALANKLSTQVGTQNLGTGIGALAAYWNRRRA